VLSTETGATLPIPTNDEHREHGDAHRGRGSHASGTALTLSQVNLGAYLYSSKIVKISWQLLQDSAIDFEALAGRGSSASGSGASRTRT